MAIDVTLNAEKLVRRPGQYPLKSNAIDGFREAVNNNQQTLALEYLRYIIDALIEAADTSDLDGRIKAIEASLASSRKVTKVAAAAGE